MIEVLVLVGYLAITIGMLGVVLSRSFVRSSCLRFSDNGLFDGSESELGCKQSALKAL